jgi:hypothetical protein
MDPRPILLVKEPMADGSSMNVDVEGALKREGYFVLRCPGALFDDVKVLTPCPFTWADVETLREVVDTNGESRSNEECAAIDSIRSRIEGMLETKEARS